MSVGSCWRAALKKVSAGRNITTNSGDGWNCAQYALAPRLVTWSRDLAGVLPQVGVAQAVVGGFDRVEVGEEGGLGVDHQLSTARQPYDQVGTRRPSSVVIVCCSWKSQWGSMPASSTTRRSCISPHRPRTIGVAKRSHEIGRLAVQLLLGGGERSDLLVSAE